MRKLLVLLTILMLAACKSQVKETQEQSFATEVSELRPNQCPNGQWLSQLAQCLSPLLPSGPQGPEGPVGPQGLQGTGGSNCDPTAVAITLANDPQFLAALAAELAASVSVPTSAPAPVSSDSAAGAADDSEGYVTGPLAGSNGGAGWNGAWTVASGGDFEVTASSSAQGSLSIQKIDTLSNGIVQRPYPALTSGTLSFWSRKQSTVAVTMYVTLRDSTRGNANVVGSLAWLAHGNPQCCNIQLWDGTTYQNLGAYTVDGWDAIEIQFGGAGGVCLSTQYRARMNAGAWSACYGQPNGGGSSNLFEIEFAIGPGPIQFWIDDIRIAP